MRLGRSLATIFGLMLVSATAPAEIPVRVAVASNFAAAANALAEAFEADGGERIVTSAASTGKLFAQISNGAPFDVLLAADVERPERLEATGLAVPGSRFTYAVGQLVVWSRDPGLAAGGCRDAVLAATTARIAIANPRTAPYGEAARQSLVALGVWETVRPRLVFGENVAQTLQFVATGNATLGFVAAAQVGDADLPAATCVWRVPADYHAPIEQQAVLLTRAADNNAAIAFLDFLKSEEARAMIRDFGYGIADSG